MSGIGYGRANFDAKHPLAGQTVGFTVTVITIRPASDAEVARGMPRPEDSLQPLQQPRGPRLPA